MYVNKQKDEIREHFGLTDLVLSEVYCFKFVPLLLSSSPISVWKYNMLILFTTLEL